MMQESTCYKDEFLARSKNEVSVRVGKILSTRRPYCIIGTAVPYNTSFQAGDKGALGMCRAMDERAELGPAHERATPRVPLTLVLGHPNDSLRGVLWRGHSRLRKSTGFFNSHTVCLVRSSCSVLSMSPSIFI